MKDEKEREDIKKRSNQLEIELEKAMNTVQDEFSVNRINIIINELERLQEKKTEVDYSVLLDDFKRNFLPTAEQLHLNYYTENKSKHKFSRKVAFTFASFLCFAFICLSTISFAIANMSIFEVAFYDENDVLVVSSKINDEYDSKDIMDATDNHVNGITEVMSFAELEEFIGRKVVKPTYMPENSKLQKIEVLSSSEIVVTYQSEDKTYLYMISFLQSDSDAIVLEKTKDKPYIYTKDNVDYYITSNIHWTDITWEYQNQLCNITGQFDDTQWKKIIKNLEY